MPTVEFGADSTISETGNGFITIPTSTTHRISGAVSTIEVVKAFTTDTHPRCESLSTTNHGTTTTHRLVDTTGVITL